MMHLRSGMKKQCPILLPPSQKWRRIANTLNDSAESQHRQPKLAVSVRFAFTLQMTALYCMVNDWSAKLSNRSNYQILAGV